jgi:hypothetical protein
MSETQEMIRRVEIYLNGLGAELTVQKIILQVFISHLVMALPNFSEEVLRDLKSETIATLRNQPISPQDDTEGQRRSKVLSIEHGERFFRELENWLATMRNKAEQSRH